MKYQSFYLRAESYDAFFTTCANAGLVSEGKIITASHNHSMILLGTLYKETGAILQDGEGNDYPEKVAIPGYHVNLRAKQPVGLEHLAVDPTDVLVEWA